MFRTLLAVILALAVSTAGAQIVNRPVAAGAISNPGTSLPSTCAVGYVYFKSNSTAGQNLHLCTAANTWTQMTGGNLANPVTPAQGGSGVANSKNLTWSNSLTLAGTDATTMTFPSTSATIARTDAANTFTGTQTFGAVVGSTWNGNTWATGTGTLSIAASKTLTASNSITLAGTDSTTMTFPTTSATIARTDSAQTFTGTQTFGVMNTAAINSGVTGGAYQISVPTATSIGWHQQGVGGRGSITLDSSFNMSFSTNGGQQAFITDTPSAVNYVNFNGAVTGSGPLVSALGSDATVPLNLKSKSASPNTGAIIMSNSGTGAFALRTAQTTAPTCTSNCGTSPSVVGTDSSMTVTMGGSGVPASGFVVTFNGTWSAAPACVGVPGTAGTTKYVTAIATTTTTATVSTAAAPANSDKYHLHCIGVS